MLTPKHPQKPPSATIAHLNDLLDEALRGTFPASDPIAIDVELEPPGHGMAVTPVLRTPLRSMLRPRKR
jgi:hypothetical protein